MTYARLFLIIARDAIAHYHIELDLCELKDYLAAERGYERSEVLSQDDGCSWWSTASAKAGNTWSTPTA